MLNEAVFPEPQNRRY